MNLFKKQPKIIEVGGRIFIKKDGKWYAYFDDTSQPLAFPIEFITPPHEEEK